MNMNYYFIEWFKEENKSFDTLVNGNKKYTHKYGCELLLASVKKPCYGAIAKKFQNDK